MAWLLPLFPHHPPWLRVRVAAATISPPPTLAEGEGVVAWLLPLFPHHPPLLLCAAAEANSLKPLATMQLCSTCCLLTWPLNPPVSLPRPSLSSEPACSPLHSFLPSDPA